MFFNRPWKIITIIALAQVAIIACYMGATIGDASPVTKAADKGKSKKKSAAAKKKSEPKHAKQNHEPKLMQPDKDEAASSKKDSAELVPLDAPITKAALETAASAPDKAPPKTTDTAIPTDPPGTPVASDTKEPAKAPPSSPEGNQGTGTGIPPASDLSATKDRVPVKPSDGVAPIDPLTPIPSVPPLGPSSSEVGPPPTPRTPAVSTPCPWTLRIGLEDGKTILTATAGKEVHFKIVCDQLNLQAPRGNIEAQGCVKVSSAGLEGTCDRLSISWQLDEVVLVGQAQLKCQREGQDVELRSDRLSLRLSPVNVKKTASREGDRHEARRTKGKKKRLAETRHTVSLLAPSRGL
jgi:hypothetical protein